MKNKIVLSLGIALVVVLSATQAINYINQPVIPQAVLKAVELGMDKTTAQAMFDDGVAAHEIRPRFVSAWLKDKQGQVEGAKQFEALQAKMNNPDLKAAFAVLGSDKTKQLLLEKDRAVQLKSDDNNKRSSLSLAEIKNMMSHDEFMAYTDMLWHRRTSQPLLKYPQFDKKTGNQIKAATLTVGDTNNAGCGFPNIQTALNFAQDGDFISVSEDAITGVNAQFSVLGKSVTITGGLDSTCSVFTANRTPLQAGVAGAVVNIDVSGGKNVTLAGFDISGSQTDASDFSSGVVITSDNGFGTVTLSNNHIHDNNSKLGGGVAIMGGALVSMDQNTEIYSNNASNDGGGIYCKDSALSTQDVLIGRFNGVAQGNMASSGNGGGIFEDNCSINLGSSAGPVEISYNQANLGSALYLLNNSPVTMKNASSRISFNENGYIIYMENGALLTIEDAQVTDNTNNTNVFRLDNISVLNIKSLCEASPCATVSRNDGAVFSTGGSSIMNVVKTVISDNTGNIVDSASSTGTLLFISNSLISNNTADKLFIMDSLNGSESKLSLDFNTIVNNTGSNAVMESINNSSITFTSNILWNNSFANLQTGISADITVVDSVIQYDPTGFANTVQQDPVFVDAANNNFHIQRTSPAMDRGTSVATEDIDGDVRPLGLGKEAGMDEYADLVGINGAACDYPTVSMAIAASSAGDTIYISKGTYVEQLGVIDKDLDFVSATDDCAAVNMAALSTDVVIDGGNQFSTNGGIVNIVNSATVSFSNLSLKNAQAQYGGIINIADNTTLVLTNVNVSNGTTGLFGTGGNINADGAGSSIILNGDTAIFSGVGNTNGGGISSSGVVIMNDTSHIGVEDFGNSAIDGAGIHFSLGGSITMNNQSSIYANVATGASGMGGGIFGKNIVAKLMDDANIGLGFDATGNRAKTGAGMYLEQTSDNAQHDNLMQGNAKVQHNLSFGNGAGIAMIDNASMDFISGAIEYNRIDPDVGDDFKGVGLYSDGMANVLNFSIGSNFVIRQNKKVDDDGKVSGGGVAIDGANTTLNVSGDINNNTASKVGAGLAIFNGAHVVLNQAEVRNNNVNAPGNPTFEQQGGGIWLGANTDLIVNDSMIVTNIALYGGGIYALNSTLTINGNNGGSKLDTNFVNKDGGAVNAVDSTITVSGDVSVSSNNARNGAGLMLDSTPISSTTNLPNGILIDNNSGLVDGAGIFATNNSPVNLSNGVFSNNTAVGKGGALYNDLSNSVLTDMQFINNSADLGGAIYEAGFSWVVVSGSLNCVQSQIAPNYCSNFTGNSATTAGAAILVNSQDGSNLFQMFKTVVHDNTSNPQGSILISSNSTTADFKDSLFYNNGSQGILSASDSKIKINRVTMNNSGLNIAAPNVDTFVKNTIVWNAPVTVPAGMTGFCNISPNNELTGINSDPLFETSLEGPYHLAANSPAIDVCADVAGENDLDGRARTINSNSINNAGFETDMGAFERPLFGNLIVTKIGMGSVVSDLAGINCGVDCTESYELGKTVQLSATPAAGFLFKQWTGACFNQSATCNIAINGLTETDVEFVELFTLTVSVEGVGSGHIESAIPGINCGTTCTGDYEDGTSVTLNAITDNMVTSFDHWQGACQGQGASCTLTMDADKDSQAFFTAPELLFKDDFE